jgi:hypothetical protein
MQIVTLDFETYFDKDYSLSKLSTEEYIRDPRFEIHGLAIRWPDLEYGSVQWYTAEEFDGGKYCKDQIAEWACLCHHAQFDGLILSHHYGIKPALWLDTLSMSRLLLGNHVTHSLDGVRQQLGLPPKSTPYNLFKGLHWSEMGPVLQAQLADGCKDEVESIYEIFNKFISGDY